MNDPKNLPRFTLDHLQNYIQLTALMQGKVPTEIRVSQDAFNWYRDQRKAVANNFNMGDVPNKDTDLSFMGVKLVAILDAA